MAKRGRHWSGGRAAGNSHVAADVGPIGGQVGRDVQGTGDDPRDGSLGQDSRRNEGTKGSHLNSGEAKGSTRADGDQQVPGAGGGCGSVLYISAHLRAYPPRTREVQIWHDLTGRKRNGGLPRRESGPGTLGPWVVLSITGPRPPPIPLGPARIVSRLGRLGRVHYGFSRRDPSDAAKE